MKILVIHQYYLFAGQPGGSRFNELSRLWTDAGHEVTVVAGTLNYATGEVPPELRGKWVSKHDDAGVTVYRCYVPASYGKSYLGRMWAFFGFTLSATTAALRVKRPDVVIATSPPLITPIPGWLRARLSLRKVPFIFEIRDLWPESAITTGVLSANGVLTKILFALERWSCGRADRINVLTPAFRDNLLQRKLAPAEKIVFVPNGADVSMFSPTGGDDAMRKELGWGDKFVVMYAGAHGRANALRQLIDTAEILRAHEDILIAAVGDGPERRGLMEEVAKRGLTNLIFHGAVSKDVMSRVVNACDVGAAVLQNNPTFRTVYPNKVFDYMACEKPTLLAIDGVARELVVDQAQAGVFAEPENASDIAAKILQLKADPEACGTMGRSGRQWVLENATREALAERYLEVMKEVVS